MATPRFCPQPVLVRRASSQHVLAHRCMDAALPSSDMWERGGTTVGQHHLRHHAQPILRYGFGPRSASCMCCVAPAEQTAVVLVYYRPAPACAMWHIDVGKSHRTTMKPCEHTCSCTRNHGAATRCAPVNGV
eukprot:6555454-Prymnesium_polylepis.3